MRRRSNVPHLIWLVVVWVALWGEASVANLLSGLLVAGVLLALRPEAPTRRGRLRPIAVARFFAYFLWKLVESSVVVAWEVVTPRSHVREGIVAVPLRGPSDALITVVADSITLTPGTLTLDVQRDPTVLFLHLLHLKDVEAVRREVHHLEELAIAAFGSDEDRAALRDEPLPSFRPSQATTAVTDPEEDVR
jgi:multicomponent Na+:H+ antiporter subunit E